MRRMSGQWGRFKMENEKFYSLEDIVKMDIDFAVKKGWAHYGVEYYADKVKEIYGHLPKMCSVLLEAHERLLREYARGT